MQAVLECKRCGGSLQPNGNKIVYCGYCGSANVFTIVDRFTLYNQANYLRQRNEFDRAISVYENILNEDPGDAEAYFGIALCKYGIEYVNDPNSNSRIPTCHRTRVKLFSQDDDYLKAVSLSDPEVAEVYKRDADSIDYILKRIQQLSFNQKKYDVFICYKESDENGERTQTSVIAQNIYEQLSSRGYRVFFARKTLSGMLGSDYEPIIFSALFSAKVMLVIGCRPEEFQGIWVRNEWIRFMERISNGEECTLIPCYKGMSPYELPSEMINIQSLDISKIGFIQDITDALERLIKKDRIVNIVEASGNSEGLRKRAYLFLEEGNFNQALNYFDKSLDINPEDSECYWGKMLVAYHCCVETMLSNLLSPISGDKNYLMALRFANEEQAKRYKGYSDIIDRNIAEENKRREEQEKLAAEEAERQRKEAEEKARLAAEEARRQAQIVWEEKQKRRSKTVKTLKRIIPVATVIILPVVIVLVILFSIKSKNKKRTRIVSDMINTCSNNFNGSFYYIDPKMGIDRTDLDIYRLSSSIYVEDPIREEKYNLDLPLNIKFESDYSDENGKFANYHKDFRIIGEYKKWLSVEDNPRLTIFLDGGEVELGRDHTVNDTIPVYWDPKEPENYCVFVRYWDDEHNVDQNWKEALKEAIKDTVENGYELLQTECPELSEQGLTVYDGFEFQPVYINDDDIPEIVIVPSLKGHMVEGATTKYIVYMNKGKAEVKTFGREYSVYSMDYIPYSNMVKACYEEDGVYHEYVFFLTDQETYGQTADEILWEGSQQMPPGGYTPIREYKSNGESCSEDQYRKDLDSVFSGKSRSLIIYNRAYKFDYKMVFPYQGIMDELSKSDIEE